MTKEYLKHLRTERRELRKELAKVKYQIEQMGWYTTVPNHDGMHDANNKFVNEMDYTLYSKKFEIQRRLMVIKFRLNSAGYRR